MRYYYLLNFVPHGLGVSVFIQIKELAFWVSFTLTIEIACNYISCMVSYIYFSCVGSLVEQHESGNMSNLLVETREEFVLREF